MDQIISYVEKLYPQILDWLFNQGPMLLLILLGAWLVLLICRRLLRSWARAMVERAEHRQRLEAKKRIQTLSQLALNTFTIALLILAAIMVLGQLGVNIGPILAAAGVLGIAVGFGTQSLVKDVVTGLFMLVENQFNVGDVVSIAG
jgi:small-conductance mechanosensitive channel